MQTITIAVSAILIAAGLITAPGLINNARDNNARGDLANVAYAQEFALASDGKYQEILTPEQEEEVTGVIVGNNLMDMVGEGLITGEADAGLKFIFSDGVKNHEARVCDDPAFYLLKSESASGDWFYRSSSSSKTSNNINDIEVPAEVLANPACSDILAGFEEEPSDGTELPTGTTASFGIDSVDLADFGAGDSVTITYNGAPSGLDFILDNAVYVEAPNGSAFDMAADAQAAGHALYFEGASEDIYIVPATNIKVVADGISNRTFSDVGVILLYVDETGVTSSMISINPSNFADSLETESYTDSISGANLTVTTTVPGGNATFVSDFVPSDGEEEEEEGIPGDGYMRWGTDLTPDFAETPGNPEFQDFYAGLTKTNKFRVSGTLGAAWNGGHHITDAERALLPTIPEAAWENDGWDNYFYSEDIISSSIVLPNGETAVGKRTVCEEDVYTCNNWKLGNKITFDKWKTDPVDRVTIHASSFEFENEYSVSEFNAQLFDGAIVTVTTQGDYGTHTFEFKLYEMSYAT